MLNDVQSRKIAKYRKLASKNKFCKYLAVFLMIWTIFWNKFLSFHKRRLVILAELCLVVVIFTFSTSFAPPVFKTASVSNENLDTYESTNVQPINTENISADIYSEVVRDEHDLVDTSEDTANLDDLIEKTKENAGMVSSKPESTSATFNKDDWNLLLINKQHTIPDDYEFIITKKGENVSVSASEAYKIIGNAVPPLLAYHIAKRIEDNWKKYFGG